MAGEVKEAIKTVLKSHPLRGVGSIIEGLHEGVANELEEIGGPAKYGAAFLRASPLNIFAKTLNGVSDTVGDSIGEGVGQAIETISRVGRPPVR